MVKTKIICTIGPGSSAKTLLRKMILGGMDVARLNFSHGDHPQQLRRINLIRELNRRYRRHIRILQDLQGYRIRIGRFKDPEPDGSSTAAKKEIYLKKKASVVLTNKNIPGEKNIIPFDYRGDMKDIAVGSNIYIDDGNIVLTVRARQRYCLKAEVIIPGVLKENKGVNIPDVNLKVRGVTPKDITDIEFGVKNRVDYIAQSFVRDASDIFAVRRLIKNRLPDSRVIAKIENRQGIDNIDEIIDASDGIMIARGDMGVSIPIYEVPIVQKQIIKKCNRAGKFVITATQMLESMVENIRPTRAEVSDVANAILDGSGFVMLSEETAAGKYPVETVKMMNQIIKFTEASMPG